MNIFITGIDTDSGKSIITGLIAKYLVEKHKTVVTQKYVQTGCTEIAEDIVTHRKIMNIDLLEEDIQHITCSYLFKHPASPHLAAEIEGVNINPQLFTDATRILAKDYEFVLMEGAGGLMVPLNSEILLIDYIQEHNYPSILVSSSKLGSINHTLLSLEVLRKRNINVVGLVYNQFPDLDPAITKDSEQIIKSHLKNYFPNAGFVSIPKIDIENPLPINFSNIL